MSNIRMAVPIMLATSGSTLFFLRNRDIYEIRRGLRKKITKIKDTSGVRSRLHALGGEVSYEKFRITQVSRSLGLSCALFLVLYVYFNSLFVASTFSAFAAAGIFLSEDRRLSSRVRRQKIQIEAEFASTVEMLTLALSAGETPLSAIIGISQRANGLFARQLGLVVDSVKSGKSFYLSLDEMGRRIESVPIRRFVDALITAMTRGAPLIELLHIHAEEARTTQRNIIMDKAGKAEMSMMIPVVFLILPISILFALWPSFTHLNLFAS